MRYLWFLQPRGEQLLVFSILHIQTPRNIVKIDKPLLQKIAQLAQLEVDGQREEILLEDLNRIITWIGKLKELDTAGVKPLITMALEHELLQEDVPQAPLAHEKGLVNAPSKDSNYFRVPRVKA